MIERVFLSYLGVSLAVAAVLLLLLVLERPFLRRTTAAGRSVLWCLLAVYLLLPWRLPLPVPEVEIPDVRIAAAQTAGEPSAARPGEESEIPVSAAPQKDRLSVLRLLSLFWMAGAAAFLLRQGGTYLVLRHRLLKNAAPPEGDAAALLEKCAAGFGLSRAPLLLVSPAAQSPMVLGFFRPVLLLPGTAEEPEDLELIFRHELTHIRRRDLWRKLLLSLAACVHWYDPLVRRMVRRAALDLELACDDRMLRGSTQEERAAYGRRLVELAAAGKADRHTLLMPIIGGAETMKTRIENILRPAGRRGIIPLALILALALLLGNLTACTTAVKPQYRNGILEMGSLFDQVRIDRGGVELRGLSKDTTAEELLEYYGMTEEDVTRIERDLGGTPALIYVLNRNVRLQEAEEYPAALQLYFNAESHALRRVTIGIEYAGADWQTAYDEAAKLLDKIEQKVGKTISFEQRSGDERGWIVNDSGDSLEQLSDPDTYFTRQYMHMGGKQTGFSVSLSHQDLSGTDMTEALGQDVDSLFSFSLNVPLYDN